MLQYSTEACALPCFQYSIDSEQHVCADGKGLANLLTTLPRIKPRTSPMQTLASPGLFNLTRCGGRMKSSCMRAADAAGPEATETYACEKAIKRFLSDHFAFKSYPDMNKRNLRNSYTKTEWAFVKHHSVGWVGGWVGEKFHSGTPATHEQPKSHAQIIVMHSAAWKLHLMSNNMWKENIHEQMQRKSTNSFPSLFL